MANEVSAAPKERVNIVYQSATGNAKEDVELPLRLVMMGDYTQREDNTDLIDRELKEIDKSNFDEVMKSFNLSLDISVPDRLGDDPENRIPINLEFKGIKDFTPDEIVQQVPHLAKMIELRQALAALRGPMSNKKEFRKAIQNILSDDNARRQIIAELGLDNTKA